MSDPDDLMIDENGEIVPATEEQQTRQWERFVRGFLERLLVPRPTIADLAAAVDEGAELEDRQTIVDTIARVAVVRFLDAQGIGGVDISDARLELEGGVLSLVYSYTLPIHLAAFTHGFEV